MQVLRWANGDLYHRLNNCQYLLFYCTRESNYKINCELAHLLTKYITKTWAAQIFFWVFFVNLQFLHVLLIHLKDAGSVRCPPGIQQIVFASTDKPFATVCKFEWQDTTFMQMKLVLVWLWWMKYFNITALHPDNTINTGIMWFCTCADLWPLNSTVRYFGG